MEPEASDGIVKLGLGPKCLDPLSESVPSHGQGGEEALMGQNLGTLNYPVTLS